jgi:hypothetical protein
MGPFLSLWERFIEVDLQTPLPEGEEGARALQGVGR